MQQTQMKKCPSFGENSRSRIQQLESMQRQIHAKFDSQKINEKSIIFIGDTNVGKTALLYYLSGMKLNLIENTIKKTKQIQPQTVYLNAKVSNSLSTTEVPNIFSLNQGSMSVSLIDMPGMNDKRFINVLSNMFTFNQVFQKLKKTTKIHIVFVISQEIFDFQQIKQNLRQFVSRFNVQSFRQTKNISIIFTKTEDDQQAVKQKFIEILQEINSELQDDEEQKDIVSLINLIQQLNQSQRIIYVFPKIDPIEDSGLQITKSILERDCFGNINQLLLHQLFIDNVITSQKSKISSFENNFMEVLQESYLQILQSVDFSIGFTKFLHKKIIPGMFQSQEDFKNQLQGFHQKYNYYLLNDQNLNNQLTLQGFLEQISQLCEQISESKQIYALDKGLKQFFVHHGNDQQSSGLQIDFMQKKTKLLGQIFDKIIKVLEKSSQYRFLITSIQQIKYFQDWLSESWFPLLVKIEAQVNLKRLINQNNQQSANQIVSIWQKISSENLFIETLNKFSMLSDQQEDTSQSESQEQTQVHQDKGIGYTNSTLKQLKKKLFKVQTQSIQVKIDSQEDLIQKILKDQEEMLEKIQSKVKQIEEKVIDQVKKAEQSGKYQIQMKPDQISFILFNMRNLRHKIFLESALKHFGQYLKFIHYSLNLESQRRQLMQILRGFVNNLCVILDQYSLFEQEILLMLFSSNYQKIPKIIESGQRTGRIGKQFLKTQVIDYFLKSGQNTIKYEALPQISCILMSAYNYLIVHYSEQKKKTKEYEGQLSSILKKLNQKNQQVSKSYSQRSTNLSGVISNEQSPNYSVLINNPYFEFQTILNKVDILQKRNKNIQTYKIYHYFNQLKNFYPREN